MDTEVGVTERQVTMSIVGAEIDTVIGGLIMRKEIFEENLELTSGRHPSAGYWRSEVERCKRLLLSLHKQ